MKITATRNEPILPPPTEFTLVLSAAEFKKLARAAFTTWSGASSMTKEVLDVYAKSFGGHPTCESVDLLAGHLRK